MMLNFFLWCCGAPRPSGPTPGVAGMDIPFAVVGCTMLAMLLSILLRYNQRFREFWERHVCAWMEEHAVNKSDETKGGL